MARQRTGIMLAKPFEERRFDAFPKPCIVQPKLEGDRLRAEPWRGCLFSSTSAGRNSLPHIREELQQIGTDFKTLEFDGEAFKLGMSHSDIRSIVSRTVNLHPEYKKIEYHIFDIVENTPQADRLHQLQEFFLAYRFKYLKMVPYKLINTLEELDAAYEEFLEQGYEGIIIRNPFEPYVRSAPNHFGGVLKLKPRMSESFKIIGFQEEISIHGEPKGTLGAIWLVNDEGTKFKVGTGPTDRQRALIWEYQEHLKGQRCKIRFQSFTKARGVPKMQSIDTDWLKSVEKILSP